MKVYSHLSNVIVQGPSEILEFLVRKHLDDGSITLIVQREYLVLIRSLRELDIVNFFIIGRLKTIKNVLDAADENQYFGRKTAWFALSLDKGDISCGCKDATIVYMRPTPDAKSRDRLGKIKTTYSMNGEPEITSAFYFDMSLRTFLAVK